MPIYVAASGPAAARLAGRVADGFICTSGKGVELYTETLLPAVARRRREGRPRLTTIDKHDRDEGLATTPTTRGRWRTPRSGRRWRCPARRRSASRTRARWSALAKRGRAERPHAAGSSRPTPTSTSSRSSRTSSWGFTHLVFHFPGEDQVEAIDRYAETILPRLRSRFG